MRHTPGIGTAPVATEQWVPIFLAVGSDAIYWINLTDGTNATLERRLK